MSSAFEKDASFPVLLAAGDAGSIRAMGVGVSSLRKRPNNPPPFFLSFSASPEAGCFWAGGAHSSTRVAWETGDSCGAAGVGPPHGSPLFGSSLGFAVGAQAFAGASVDAGGGVVQDSAGLPAAGAPPPGARHQSVGWASAFAGAEADWAGAFAAGPGANRPESEESRLSIAGGTAGAGGSGTGSNPPMRCAISACRSSRISG